MFIRSISVIALFIAGAGLAQEQDRSEMIKSYSTYMHSGNSLLSAPPINHVVPQFNTLTYAIAYEHQDLTVLPRTESGDLDTQRTNRLHLSGYTIDPHLSISLKKVGLGFSVETSKHQADYTDNSLYSSSAQQHSTVTASGLGFNLSSLPFDSLRKENKLALIVGVKSLNVKHELTPFYQEAQAATVETQTAHYNILRYSAGANLTLQLLKHFSVIPWIDYGGTDLKAARSAFSEERFGTYLAEQYADDLRLFYEATPNVRYGIDLSILVFGLDVRVGSLLGGLARLNSQPDYIKDKSFTIGLSFDQKGG